jgi:hypothetical protein
MIIINTIDHYVSLWRTTKRVAPMRLVVLPIDRNLAFKDPNAPQYCVLRI